jgi:hypothetical protein
MTENKLGLNWSAVEKALAEGTYSGYKIGILETEKILDEMLSSKQVPGKSADQKIKYVQKFLSLPDKLEYGRNIHKRIIHEPHFEISREETKHIILGYWQAMLDLEEAIASLSAWEKATMRLKYYSGLALKRIKIIGGAILGMAAFIWFLAETSAGKSAANFIAKTNHFFIFTILFWGVIILFALAIAGLIFFLVTRTKKRF